jgi:hypothetical protein
MRASVTLRHAAARNVQPPSVTPSASHAGSPSMHVMVLDGKPGTGALCNAHSSMQPFR